MQFQAILAVALLSAAQVAYAGPPPPCLLAAVNAQPNPSDFKTICAVNGPVVQKQIHSVCKGDDVSAALSSFADTCKINGVAVSTVDPSSSTSTPSYSSGSGSGTNSPTYTTTGASSVSGTDMATPDPYTSAYNLTSLFAGTSHGSAPATGTGSHSMSMGNSSTTMPMPTATGSATKTSGTSGTSGTAAGSAKPSTTSGVAGQVAGSIGGLAMVAAGAILML